MMLDTNPATNSPFEAYFIPDEDGFIIDMWDDLLDEQVDCYIWNFEDLLDGFNEEIENTLSGTHHDFVVGLLKFAKDVKESYNDHCLYMGHEEDIIE